MSDNLLINHIHDEPKYDRIWRSLTASEKRQVLEFAEGDLGLAKVALEDTEETE